MTNMSFDTLELVYEAVANAIDRAGPRNDTLMLTKLVILLANKCADLDKFTEALAIAMVDLPE